MEGLFNIFDGLAEGLKNVLPVSPFQEFLSEFAELPHLAALNWLFPIGPCLKVFAAWLIAVGLFYTYSIAMRWVKMIGD